MSSRFSSRTTTLLTALAASSFLAHRLWRRRRAQDLYGKVALVTGGSRGLGFLIARELARAGCRLVITARDPQELAKARDRLRLEGVPVWTIAADLTSKDEVERVVAEGRHYFGRIDILVNNAGMISVAPLESVDLGDFQRSLDLMFWAPLHATMAVVPHMRARGEGSIVSITSFGGLVSVPHMLPYSTAKFAHVGLSQGLHAELTRHGIHVMTVAPGTMRTGGHAQAEFGGQAAKEYKWFSLGASLPVFSTDAERAARQIVDGIKQRRPFLVIGLPFKGLVRAAGLFPGLTAAVMGWVNRLLPEPPTIGGSSLLPQVKGMDVPVPPLLKAATALGERARARFQ